MTETHEVVDEQLFCYRHQNTPTRLRCSRCEVPICGECATPASVGQHCPECVADARRSAPKVRSALRAGSPAVFFILGLNILVLVGQMAIPGLTDRFALDKPAVAGGELYRLITPMFLHVPGLLHILVNSYALYMLGPPVEESFGTVRFVGLYLVTGFAGNAASYAFGEPCIPSVGASGAIFGVMGALLVYVYNRRRHTMMHAYMRQIVGLIAINLAIGFFAGLNIDNMAHLGGLVAGMAIGAGFDQAGRGRGANPALRTATLIAVVGAVVGVVVARTSNFPGCGFGL